MSFAGIRECPGCGNRDVKPEESETSEGIVRVVCQCGWEGPPAQTEALAIYRWNKRYTVKEREEDLKSRAWIKREVTT